jgi:hypothetical protein
MHMGDVQNAQKCCREAMQMNLDHPLSLHILHGKAAVRIRHDCDNDLKGRSGRLVPTFKNNEQRPRRDRDYTVVLNDNSSRGFFRKKKQQTVHIRGVDITMISDELRRHHPHLIGPADLTKGAGPHEAPLAHLFRGIVIVDIPFQHQGCQVDMAKLWYYFSKQQVSFYPP